MKFMPFYKLYDWILEEFGASREACLLSIIYSFEENGSECRLSYTQFAEILKVSRPRAIERVQKLIESGYLSVITNGTKTNTYTVNKQAFNNDSFASAENGTSDNQLVPETELALVPETELALVPETELPSSENGTSTSAENGTQIDIIENTIENFKKESEREAAPARSSAGKVSIPDFPEIRLTPDEYDVLRYGFDMSPTKKTLDAYFSILEANQKQGKKYNDHFTVIRKWITQDGAKVLKPEQRQQNKDFAEQYASIWNDDVPY